MPRADGRLIVGATVEERGFDTTVTAGGVHELLREAYRLLPDVAELELVEAAAGLRPGTPDNLPLVGPGALEGLVLATGHFRNGILLAPLTAERVAELIAATGHRMPRAVRPRRGWRHEDRAERRAAAARRAATLAEAVREAGAAPEGRGVAVALDGEVVPRGEWEATRCARARRSRCWPRSRAEPRRRPSGGPGSSAGGPGARA